MDATVKRTESEGAGYSGQRMSLGVTKSGASNYLGKNVEQLSEKEAKQYSALGTILPGEKVVNNQEWEIKPASTASAVNPVQQEFAGRDVTEINLAITLMRTVDYGSLDDLKQKLINNPDSVNYVDDRGDTVLSPTLHFSSKLDLIPDLLAAGADPNHQDRQDSIACCSSMSH